MPLMRRTVSQSWLLCLFILSGCGLIFGEYGLTPPQSDLRPTPFPTPRPLLFPGAEAVVNTIDGEVLYLRDSPSTGGEIIIFLYNDMPVTLLEGPVLAEGYTWWRIRTADGDEGWAAEAVDTVTTLLPPPEATPEIEGDE